MLMVAVCMCSLKLCTSMYALHHKFWQLVAVPDRLSSARHLATPL